MKIRNLSEEKLDSIRNAGFFISVFFLICFGSAAGQPFATLDLAAVSTDDGILHRVYGSSGDGRYGVPVTGGSDCDGDGLRDSAVAFMTADPFGRSLAGEVHLVFGDGTTAGFIDTSVPQERLLRIAGAGPQETAGNEIWIDDVTGDGIGDLLICRQNYTVDAGRIGAGALTILNGGPALRTHAATLQTVDLQSLPAELTAMTFIGAAALDRLGIWVRTGDLTGDGIADVVVGADQEDSGGETNSGAVYVIRGGSHLAVGSTIDLASFGATPLAGNIARITPPSGATGYHFGATCQLTDLDGNGRSEVLAAAALARAGAALPAEGAPSGSAEPTGGTAQGTLYIAWDDNFAAGPWPAGYAFQITNSPGSRTVLDGAAANSYFAEEIVGGLDYDGDGDADLFLGDLAADGSPQQDREMSGISYVVFSAQQLKDLEIDLDAPPAGLTLTTILGPSAGALGGDTAAHGDFDGDGLADLAIGSPHANPQGRVSAGAVHVLYGRPSGWPTLVDTAEGSLPPASALRVAVVEGAHGESGDDAGDTLAYSAAAGDVNGDGIDDLIVNEMQGNGLAAGTVDVGNLIVISGPALAGSSIFSDGFESGDTTRWSGATGGARSPGHRPTVPYTPPRVWGGVLP